MIVNTPGSDCIFRISTSSKEEQSDGCFLWCRMRDAKVVLFPLRPGGCCCEMDVVQCGDAMGTGSSNSFALAKWAQNVVQYDPRSERRGRPGRETSVATVGVTAQATPTSVGRVRVAAEGTFSCPRCSRSGKTLHSCVCGIFDSLKQDFESPARIHRGVTSRSSLTFPEELMFQCCPSFGPLSYAPHRSTTNTGRKLRSPALAVSASSKIPQKPALRQSRPSSPLLRSSCAGPVSCAEHEGNSSLELPPTPRPLPFRRRPRRHAN